MLGYILREIFSQFNPYFMSYLHTGDTSRTKQSTPGKTAPKELEKSRKTQTLSQEREPKEPKEKESSQSCLMTLYKGWDLH